jgi:surface protein
LHPNACPSDGFLGRIFKSVVFEKCWIFEAFAGGQIKVDPTDSTCSGTTPHSSTYPLSEYKQNMSNKILFEANPGTTEPTWGGYIEILEDTKSTQESLELTKLGWNTNEVVFTLTVPLCPSSAPSEKPSSKPSVSVSSEPSIQPTVNKPTYTAFKTNDELKNAVRDYCSNPDGWKYKSKFSTHGPIEDWNTSEITDMNRLFQQTNCDPNLAKWDVSKVTTFDHMFASAYTFNQDLSNWDTSSATNFYGMFYQARDFNGDISTWDTSSVSIFQLMFQNAKAFNQNLSNWDTSSATTFRDMFAYAYSFNQDLSNWDTSSVTTFRYMFNSAYAFNQDLSNWDTSSATNFYGMFMHATSFSGDVREWDTSKVTNFAYMFQGAGKFNQDLSNWDTSSATSFQNMFFQAIAFDQNLCKWNVDYTDRVNMYFCGNAISCGKCD